MRLLLGMLALLVAVVSAWQFRDRLGLPVLTDAAAVSGARKCMRNGQVLYTTEPCPAGSREQALSGGTLTVVKALPAATPAASTAPGSPGKVRDLLLDAKAVNIKEQQMEAVIGR